MPDFFIVAYDRKTAQYFPLKMREAYSSGGKTYCVPDVDYKRVGYSSMEKALAALSENMNSVCLDRNSILKSQVLFSSDITGTNNRGLCILSSWKGIGPIKSSHIFLPESAERLVAIEDVPELVKTPHRINTIVANSSTGLFHRVTWKRRSEAGSKASYGVERIEPLCRAEATLEEVKGKITTMIQLYGRGHYPCCFMERYFLQIDSADGISETELTINGHNKANPLAIDNIHVRFPGRSKGHFIPMGSLSYVKNLWDRLAGVDDAPSEPETSHVSSVRKHLGDSLKFGPGR